GLVDHRLVVLVVRWTVVAPVEERVDDHRVHRVRRGVQGAAPGRLGQVVGVQRLVPVDAPVDRLGVGVQQQLGRVAPVALGGVVGAVDPVAVPLPGLGGPDVAVPHVPVHLGEVDALLTTVVVQQAELHPLGDGGEEGEVGAGAVEGGTQRIGTSGPRLHAG